MLRAILYSTAILINIAVIIFPGIFQSLVAKYLSFFRLDYFSVIKSDQKGKWLFRVCACGGLVTSISSLLIFIFSSSPYVYSEQASNLQNDLRHSVIQYYNFERIKNWKSTYSFRTHAFRTSVSFENYKRIMDRDTEGWELIKFHIKSLEVKDNSGSAEIVFYETMTQKSYLGHTIKKVVKICEVTTWELINNAWYARAPGVRYHLSLNVDLVETG